MREEGGAHIKKNKKNKKGGHKVVCDGIEGHVSRGCGEGEAIKNSQLWVVIGDQELPTVITRGVIWHYSRVYDV